MCDEAKLARWAKGGLTRRQFGALGAAGAAAACAPIGGVSDQAAIAAAPIEQRAGFATPDGTMDGFFVHPADARSPAVLFWPDIAGLRDSMRTMARRLAGSGYAVLVVNPYYRDVAGEQFFDFAAFAAEQGFEKVRPWRARLDAEAIMRDARAAVGWLDAQPAVDSTAGVGTQGYCMGGPFAVWTAAAVPDRVRAAASFHGGGLVREGQMSPHRLLDETQASYLIAIAQDDDAENPEHKTILREAAAEADVAAEIEVYPADHGWTVPDAPAYDQAAAERAWANLLELYGPALR